MRLFLAFFFILLSCQSLQRLDSDQKALLFPKGVYKQTVSIQFQEKSVDRSFTFDAILKKSANGISLYAYNSLGISLMSLKDQTGKELEFSSSIDELAQKREFFLGTYAKIKKILLFSKNGYKSELAQLDEEFHGHFELIFEPESAIPREIKIDGKEKYQIRIVNKSFVALAGE